MDADKYLERLERSAKGWHLPAYLRWVVPTAARDSIREMRERIFVRYAVRQLPIDKEFMQTPEDALASESFSIIVAVHDAPEVTKRCMVSLQKFAPKAEIILVDDGSQFEETQTLLKEFSNRNSWRLVRHPKPLGHSAACRAGVQQATRPLLCLLNSDTVVTPWCWRPIAQAFQDDPFIAVAGPSTSSAANEQTIPLAHDLRLYLNDSQICEYAGRLLSKTSGSAPKDLRFVSGFAFFIRRAIWERLGGFDQNLPDYGNEEELCMRVLDLGYRAVWVRNSYIHHFESASYKRTVGATSISMRKKSAATYIKDKRTRANL